MQDAYFKRINYRGPISPDLETLKQLHLAHMLAVPFENMDIPLNVPISVKPQRAIHKIVNEGRGGFCYEANGAFAELLRSLGFRVDLLSARVYGKGGKPGIPFDHLTLLVHLEEPVMADVGFGDSFIEPIPLRGSIQEQRGTAYQFVPEGNEYVLQRRQPGEQWENQYMFSLKPYSIEAFADACHYQQTSPKSSFTQKTICSRLTTDGRVSLANDRLILTCNGEKETQPIRDTSHYQELLHQHFGIQLADTSNFSALMRRSASG